MLCQIAHTQKWSGGMAFTIANGQLIYSPCSDFCYYLLVDTWWGRDASTSHILGADTRAVCYGLCLSSIAAAYKEGICLCPFVYLANSLYPTVAVGGNMDCVFSVCRSSGRCLVRSVPRAPRTTADPQIRPLRPLLSLASSHPLYFFPALVHASSVIIKSSWWSWYPNSHYTDYTAKRLPL